MSARRSRSIITPVVTEAVVYEKPCKPIYSDGLFWVYFLVVALLMIWGGYITYTNRGWYEALNQPAFRPPAYFFSFIWLILYFLVAFSSYLGASSAVNPSTRLVINLLFALNILLNVAWIYAFYVKKDVKLAFWITIALIISALLLMGVLFSVNALTGSLLVIYVIWLIIAAAYNWQVWKLNPTQ